MSSANPSQDERPAVLFHCQHSLGLGHLVRSLALGAALAEHFRVVMVCGGKIPASLPIPPGVETVQLPPVRMDESGLLVSHDGRRRVDAVMAQRQQLILDVFAATKPVAVIVELFPFGRKKFAAELVPLLDAARAADPPALTVCSVRDLLVAGRADQERHDEKASVTANQLLDAVLVHTDPQFARFEESFHPRTPLGVPVHSTGFVVPVAPPSTGSNPVAGHIVVSAGGGAAGADLLRAAAGAHDLLGDRPMTIITGPFVPDDVARFLRARANLRPGLTVRRFLPDLATVLSGAAVSVSQCGYNTALDVLRAQVPALFVPFATEREDEQIKRATRLADLGAAAVLHPRDLDARRLATAIEDALKFAPRPSGLDLGGAERTADLLVELVPRQATFAGLPPAR